MAGLRIDTSKCVGCGLCVKGCAAGALSIADKKAAVSEDCVLCGLCVDACRLGALSIVKEGAGPAEALAGLWIFAECDGAGPLPVAYELLGKGRQLADNRGCALTALLFGAGVAQYAQSLIAHGADRVLLCDDAALAHKLEGPYDALIEELIAQRRPEILLFGATGFGRSLAPCVAAGVGTGLTADCTVLEIDPESGLLSQTRPAFGGNLMATILCPNHRPQMATVRPGVMPAAAPDPARSGEIERIAPPTGDFSSVALLADELLAQTQGIRDARLIVDVGRGIGSQKNLRLAAQLAELLGGALGVSRPLVDTGWSEYKHQIGQTGCSVAPDVLICCGISGAIQHLAGIGGAKTVIAINNDPDAPIFSVAQYKIVADCAEVLKELVALIRARRG